MRILLAEDERTIVIPLVDALRAEGHQVRVAVDGREARQALAEEPFDVLVTDVRMPHTSGEQLLDEVRASHPGTEVVIMTGHGRIDAAVEAIKKGAFEYILKPFDNEEILVALRKIAEIRHLRDENVQLRRALGREKGLEQIIGRSAAMERVIARIRTVAESDARVLITGESGTGKERVARAIHETSRRARGPFIPLACAAIPAPLLEDEIFGHERGAFTDAKERKAGRFERAHGGTIFLDDIDDMPLGTQVKLLRVLQEGVVEPLGATAPLAVDVRVIAATKVDLGEAVEDGEFREDLYYRLNVVPFDLPPLREREGDIPLLVEHFLERFASGRPFTVPADVMAELCAYRWPGNVRELENAVERAVALAGDARTLSRELLLEGTIRRRRRGASEDEEGATLLPLRDVVREAEARAIRRTLRATEGHRANAAKILGVSRKNLWEKMKDYGIE